MLVALSYVFVLLRHVLPVVLLSTVHLLLNAGSVKVAEVLDGGEHLFGTLLPSFQRTLLTLLLIFWRKNYLVNLILE